MRGKLGSYFDCFLVVTLLGWAAPAFAQSGSSSRALGPAPLAPESISVVLTAPGPVHFALNGSVTTGSISPAWVSQWDLHPQRNQVQVCAYLSGALTGTGGNSDTIPPANVLGQPDGTGSFIAFTGTACGLSNAVSVSITPITNQNRHNGSKNDSIVLEISETGLNLSADTYTGTLNIIAQATP